MNFDRPHRRFNLLSGQWVLVSPHRAKRPWLGQVEKLPIEVLPAFDPGCYLCPGNARAGGKQNPIYTSTFVFDNDFSSLLPPDPLGDSSGIKSGVFVSEPEDGLCRVVCFSPRHDLTLPELPLADVVEVVRTWIIQTKDLLAVDYIQYVQVFENKGAMMGCSNPHPHSQLWATSHIPNEPLTEAQQQDVYLKTHGSCLLCDVLKAEVDYGERIVARNEDFTAVVPFWAVWPFEILLISHRHSQSLVDLTEKEVNSLADILHQITVRYDNLFEISFPYSMGFHQVPCHGEYSGWHLHAHFYPPLLRSATVRKFMVGFEMLAMPQRDITSELAAARLRSVSDTHYKKK